MEGRFTRFFPRPLLNHRLAGWLDRYGVSETGVLVAMALIVGLCTGSGAVGFIWLIGQFSVLFTAAGTWLAQTAGWWVVALIPLLGGLLGGPLIAFFAREAKGHGVPEVMSAIALQGGRIRPRVVVVKALASALCISSGGSAGREGPIVQMGSAFGSTMGQVFRLSDERIRNLVACGAAAGIAATFNIPRGDTALRAGDRVTLLVNRDKQEEAAKCFKLERSLVKEG
jgi:CIC family chloride channel protein